MPLCINFKTEILPIASYASEISNLSQHASIHISVCLSLYILLLQNYSNSCSLKSVTVISMFPSAMSSKYFSFQLISPDIISVCWWRNFKVFKENYWFGIIGCGKINLSWNRQEPFRFHSFRDHRHLLL